MTSIFTLSNIAMSSVHAKCLQVETDLMANVHEDGSPLA